MVPAILLPKIFSGNKKKDKKISQIDIIKKDGTHFEVY